MKEKTSKTKFLYRQLRHAVLAGHYAPGQRLDLRLLAEQYQISPTPVGEVLHRLVGEGLLVAITDEQMEVPLATDLDLRDLYGWMQFLLLMACDMGVADLAPEPQPLPRTTASSDIPKLTYQLFDTIALATGSASLRHAVRQTSDQLAPARRAERTLLKDTIEELQHLDRQWCRHDMRALKKALTDYHERRTRHIPRLVAVVNGAANE
ncbi:GntR family transcriptional regulator [Phytopseudomonas dryadis]|uniref:Transcriptional regulator n=1 Tax=Phytopseudomonas dryadis TaxID=2487520 RepID=A0A4Q9QVI4_9GAMM|nr:GntR family transcriptional regulator [Pseudomonas dryadis]TBU86939.1 transcriptional regulator [Pseudomonas dryadis]